MKNPYTPTNFNMSRNPLGNLGNQQAFGQTNPQPNQAGYGMGTNWNNYRMGTPTPQPVYDPPVSIPTGEHPLNPNPAMPAPALPSYAVPGGRHDTDPYTGMSMYTNPTTGMHQWGPGGGYVAAPPGSGVAFVRQSMGPIGQFLQGMPQHDNGRIQGFGNLRGIFGGY